MQLSDREVQKTLDLIRKGQTMGQQAGATALSAKEIEGIKQVAKKMGEAPPIRQDRVEKVKKDFESSSYNVSSDDVAKELIGRTISDKLT
jgi:anti-sigma28 factor (negative regulator of flagellin synthesis)